MIKILFLIHDLGQGGAEKVLVNLVNNMDKTKFDITVTALFGGGVNEQFLDSSIHYHTVWKKMIPANSKWMKLMSPEQLHAFCVKEHYDIEVSYLEGPAARVISGCTDSSVKKICWIHSNIQNIEEAAVAFRSIKETQDCYRRFDKIVCVSQTIKENFGRLMDIHNRCEVLYNTVESEKIRQLAAENAPEIISDDCLKLCAVGSLKPVKGFDRLLRIAKNLRDNNCPVHLYLLGRGPQKEELEKFVADNGLIDSVTFLGYQTNPYRYLSKCDLFVCSSLSEGFSTATTEALILGIPVCTTAVSGMGELLGPDNEYGLITANNEQALLEGIESFIKNPQQLRSYKEKAQIRGLTFNTENTVKAVENMMLSL